MKAKTKFKNLPRNFWAYVRSISQVCGYTDRKTRMVKVPTIAMIQDAFTKLNLNPSEIIDNGVITKFGKNLLEYFEYRAERLNNYVEPRLMNKDRAEKVLNKMLKNRTPNCPLPMNKQKNEKKGHAFFTCIINLIIEENLNGKTCDYDPKQLTTITKHNKPLRTLARRVDGAFPATINPSAIWEIKEYYYTTTFGSRVADGVYETLLDGMELAELLEHEGKKVHHYLMIDAYDTWWLKGKSYLCRIIDMLHMGYADEVLFGYEVIEQLPNIVNNWIKKTT